MFYFSQILATLICCTKAIQVAELSRLLFPSFSLCIISFRSLLFLRHTKTKRAKNNVSLKCKCRQIIVLQKQKRSIKVCTVIMFFCVVIRDVSGVLDSSSLSPQYRRGTRPVSATTPDCSDCHELETLMPTSAQDHTRPLTQPSEEQSLMGNVGVADDGPSESKVSVLVSSNVYN